MILIGLALWIVRVLGGGVGTPQPILTIIRVVVVVVIVVYLLRVLGLWSGGPVLRVSLGEDNPAPSFLSRSTYS